MLLEVREELEAIQVDYTAARNEVNESDGERHWLIRGRLLRTLWATSMSEMRPKQEFTREESCSISLGAHEIKRTTRFPSLSASLLRASMSTLSTALVQLQANDTALVKLELSGSLSDFV